MFSDVEGVDKGVELEDADAEFGDVLQVEGEADGIVGGEGAGILRGEVEVDATAEGLVVGGAKLPRLRRRRRSCSVMMPRSSPGPICWSTGESWRPSAAR